MAKMNGEGTASLYKALDILDEIARFPNGLNQAELSEKLDVPRTTLYRLLSALMARGLIRRDQQRRVYRLGFRCFELARKAYAAPDLVAAAAVEMRALRDLTGETSYLAVLDGNEVLSLERCDGAHSHRSAAALGERKPLHCTSQGKAILSVLEESTRDVLLKDLELHAFTPRTLTDRRRLIAELKITGQRGYAIDDEEIVLGVRCVGAPIIDGAGTVRGAISVAGPAYRLPRERLELLGPELAEAARRVGAQLTYSKTMPSQAPQVLETTWAFHGAFPQWCPRHRRLYWADTLAPALHVYDGVEDKEFTTLDGPIKVMALSPEGLVVVCESEIWLIDTENYSKRNYPAKTPTMSALTSDNSGTLWASSITEDGRWQVGSWTIANGIKAEWYPGEPVTALAWNANQEILYGIAPNSGSILLMRPRDTTVRRLTSISRGSGTLSGIAIDHAGGIWSAMYDGWGIARFDSNGNLDTLVGLNVPQPVDLAFGGEAKNGIFITTSRHSLSIDVINSAPLSGRLFHYSLETTLPE